MSQPIDLRFILHLLIERATLWTNGSIYPLELGNEVIVTGRRQAVLDNVKAKHPKLHTVQSDVADPAQIAALAAREGGVPQA